MSRPVDWDTVFEIDDPTPGDPFQIRRVATSWGGLADDAEYAETKLRALMSDDAIVGWIGEGGDAFKDKTGDLPDQLGKCKNSYRIASTALDWWATKLTTHQSDADAALVKGRAALADLHSAQADLTSADASVTSASGSNVLALSKKYADSPPPSTVHMPSSSDVRAAQNRLSAAKAAQTSASSAVSAAQPRLDAARRLALDAGELRVGDGKTTARKIDDASDAGIPERSWWDKLKDWVAEAWDIIIVVCKIVVAVLGIVALILGGPLAWIVLAAAILVLADTLMKYAKGQASLLDVALAALDCIPGGKGLTSLAKLGKLATEGKTALKAMTTTLRSGGGLSVLRSAAGAKLADLATAVPGGIKTALHAGSADAATLKSVFKHFYGDVLEVNAARFARGIPGFNMNCTRCVIATDATVAGHAASALPVLTNGASIANISTHFGQTWQAASSYEHIVGTMENLGQGARGIVFGDRGAGQVGHVFNVVNDSHGIAFIDGQIGGFAHLENFKSLWFLPTT